jgi:transcriptional regulator with XRE-family HTH domain
VKRRSRKKQWSGPLPTSGELIGALARIFDWKPQHAAQDSTWRKFTRGKHVSKETRRAILKEVIESWLHNVDEPLRMSTGEPVTKEAVVSALLHVLLAHTSWWDELCAGIQEAIPANPTEITNMVALRLAVVELAIRISAVCALRGLRAKPPRKPEHVDMQELLLPILLRTALKSARISRLKLAEELDVTKEAVDQWLARDSVIRVELLDDIAEVIADKAGEDPNLLKATLRLVRALTQMLLDISERVGSKEMNETVRALIWLTQVSLAAIDEQVASLQEPLRTRSLEQLLALGSESWLGPLLRNAMRQQEQDDSWKGVISAMPKQWDNFLARALASEMQYAKALDVIAQEGFKYLMADKESARLARMALVLVPPESFPPQFSEVLAQLTTQPHEATTELRLEMLSACFHHFASDEADPDAWRKLLENAECCRFLMRDVEPGEQLVQWQALSWISYLFGILKLLMLFCECQTLEETLTWLAHLREVHMTLPQLPEEVDSRLQLLRDHLQEMKSLLEGLELPSAPAPLA